MTAPDAEAVLRLTLQSARDALSWKPGGTPEYDVHHPVTPTGTGLLGLVKHLVGVDRATRAARSEVLDTTGEVPW